MTCVANQSVKYYCFVPLSTSTSPPRLYGHPTNHEGIFMIRTIVVRTLFCLIVCSLGTRADDDSNFAPGLLGSYATDRSSFTRIDDDILFDWKADRPDVRLDANQFRVTWKGFLFSNQPGPHRFHVYVSGKFSLKVAHRLILEGTAEEPGWFDSQPFEVIFGYQPIEFTYETKSKSARVGLYWSSESFEREPIPTSRLWHQSQSSSKKSVELLATSARCSACHDIPLEIEPAPALDQMAGSVNENWLARYLAAENEKGHPLDFGFSKSEASSVATYLISSAKKIKLDSSPTKGDKQKGEALFESVGCFACHRIDGLGAEGPFAGGDLTDVASKRPASFFAKWLRSPDAMNVDHRMPVFQFSSEEIEHLSAYLSSLRKDEESADAFAPPRADTNVGRDLVEQFRCVQCHRMNEFQTQSRLPLRLASDRADCLSAPSREQRRPGYRLSNDQAVTLREYLSSLKRSESPVSEEREGYLVLARKRCLGCHPRGNEDGLRDVVMELGASDPREQAVRVAPSLNGVGDKLRTEWIEKAISGEATARRSWLSPRMPKFKHSDKEKSALVAYLTSHDQIPSFEHPPTNQSRREERLLAAQRLVGPAGFGCMSCHQIGKFVPIVGEPSARGPDLASLGDRIRFEWYRRWTRNPSRIVSGVEMPAINLASPGLLHGDIETQLYAVWEGLNTSDFQLPAVAAVQSLTAIDAEQPIIFRDIFEHKKGDSTTRTFAVGFTNGHSLLIDLDRFAVRRWWFGDFANEQTRGKAWYWETAGTTLLDDKHAPPLLGMIDAGKLVLPNGPGQPVTELRRWYRDGDRVVFEASVLFHEMRSVDLVGTMEPIERGIRLTVRLDKSSLPGNYVIPLSKGQGEISTGIGKGHVTATGSLQEDLNVDAKSKNLIARSITDGVFTINWELDSVVKPITTIKQIPSEPAPRKELTGLPGYEIARLPLRDGPMPTGLAFHSDGTMFLTSLKGGVFRLVDSNKDGELDTYLKFADDLASPFGLLIEGDDILVSHKPELLRLKDTNRDGYADRADVVSSGWGVTADYHDWMVGPVVAKEGGYYLALSCQQDKRSPAAAIGRGKLIRTLPDAGFEIVTSGLRFPMGLAANDAGDLFATDNQGVTNPFNELNHLRPGRHYGFFSALEKKTSDQQVETPAIDIPHPWTGSVNGIAFVPKNESFGPFGGHLIGAEYTTRRLIRMSLQKVGETYQGCTYPFGEAGRSAIEKDETFLGPISLAFAKDGSLYVGSMIDSGWGGGNNRGAIEQVRFSGMIPFGILEVRAWSGGFDIYFTREVDDKLASNVAGYVLSRYRRVHTAGYATPDRDRAPVRITAARVSPDHRSVRLSIDDFTPGFVYDISIRKLRQESESTYPAVAFYTLNVVPESP